MENGDRYIHRQIKHAMEHIENKDYALALNLLRSAIKDDRVKIRKGDISGKCTNSKS